MAVTLFYLGVKLLTYISFYGIPYFGGGLFVFFIF